MDDIKSKIADITADMNFERRKPASQETKEQTKQLLKKLGEAKQRLDKLHLRLYYAVDKNDYHSLGLQEAVQELEEIRKELNSIV